MKFYDVEEIIPPPNPLELIHFMFLDEYNLTGEFVVVTDIEEFFKHIDFKALVLNVESTNEWIQIQKDGPNIILREVDKYFDNNSTIPVSNKINGII